MYVISLGHAMEATILQWCTIQPENVAVFTSENKEMFASESGLVVSTYSMVANTRNRSHDSQKVMDFLRSRMGVHYFR